ncbi:MAG TPA: type VI secretion system baseplate subunit TssK [Chthoniobacter sp.]|jgi:type VI secretion system protein ImpJ
MSSPIHWYEGLFVQPHHFQAFQRTLLHHIWSGPLQHMPFPYGVLHAEFAADKLDEGYVQFRALHAVFPSGTVFRFPEDAELTTLDIKAGFQKYPAGFIVGLALPLWRRNRPNTIPYNPSPTGPFPDLRFVAKELAVGDENKGFDQEDVPLQVLQLNGQLVFQNDPRDHMEFLPLVRILPKSAESRVTTRAADPTFVPPTLLLSGSDELFKLVTDLAAAVSGARNFLAEQLAASPLDLRALQGAQFEQMCRLRCLARGGALLSSMTDTDDKRKGCGGRLPPYDAYLAMQDLLAELSSLYPAKRIVTWAPYNHDNPYPCFADLDEKIRMFLKHSGTNFRRFKFTLERIHFFGDVPENFFQNITGCYLSIETDDSPTALARLVEDRNHFKLLPASFVEELAIAGLWLREARDLPADLPLRAGQYYYRVDTEASPPHIWERFKMEPRAAVHFQAPDLSRYRLSLYVTLPAPTRDQG